MNDYELAESLVREAGLLAMRMRIEGVDVTRKTSPSDVVSAADHAAEALITATLATERPDDGLVGEEGAFAEGERTWFVDPVDGTYNFVSGLPSWCSAVALTDSLGLVLGAVYHPVMDELWLGGRDHPTTCNGVPVPPLQDSPLAEVSIATYIHPATLPRAATREPLLRLLGAATTVRMIGSGSVELAAVSGGRLGAWAQHSSLPWDWYPGAALVGAAGGVAVEVELDGFRWHLAGAGGPVAELVEVLLETHDMSPAVDVVTVAGSALPQRLGSTL
jgi:myo-inositol-1(or 4)-monophosphatase